VMGKGDVQKRGRAMQTREGETEAGKVVEVRGEWKRGCLVLAGLSCVPVCSELNGAHIARASTW
jgi:hypothetical protein